MAEKPTKSPRARPAVKKPKDSPPAAPLLLTDSVEAAPRTEDAPAPAPEARPARVWPMLLGGVVAGGVGYGAALLPAVTGADVPAAPQTDPALVARLDAAVAEQGAMATRLSEIAAREAVDLSPLLTRFAQIEAMMATQGAALGDIAARLAAVESRAEAPALRLEGPEGEALSAEIAALQALLAEQRASLDAMADQMTGLVSEAQRDLSATAADAQVTSALARLALAVEGASPYASALADVEAALGTSAPQILAAHAEAGVSDRKALADRFPALARAALPIALQETAGEGLTTRLWAFLQGQIGGRSLHPQSGDDPDAILSRAEYALVLGDITGALDEIARLPEPAAALFAQWAQEARARLDVEAALTQWRAEIEGARG